jgi:hypothetical protein
MIKYTLQEIIKLGELYNEEEKPKYLGLKVFDYVNLINQITEEKNGNTEKILLEFIGAYNFAIYDQDSYTGTYNFLFKMPLEMMYYFVNDNTEWKSRVAKWRLNIKK